jgi:hypothetical protein
MRHTHSQMVGSFETSELERFDLVPLEIFDGYDSVVCTTFSVLVILNRRLYWGLLVY